MSRMADALIPPYDVELLASQVFIHLGGFPAPSWGDVASLLHEFGADPHHREPGLRPLVDRVISCLLYDNTFTKSPHY